MIHCLPFQQSQRYEIIVELNQMLNKNYSLQQYRQTNMGSALDWCMEDKQNTTLMRTALLHLKLPELLDIDQASANQFQGQLLKKTYPLNKQGTINWMPNSKTKGVIYDPQHYLYVGSILNNKMNGKGALYYLNNNYYVGKFRNNLPNDSEGQFVFLKDPKNQDARAYFTGQWIDGRPIDGILNLNDKDFEVKKIDIEKKQVTMSVPGVGYYSGEVNFNDPQENFISGKGKLFLNDQTEFDGTFVNGKLQGHGLQRWKDGNKTYMYEGPFKNGVKQGKDAKLHYQPANTSNYLIIDWKEGVPHGQGQLYWGKNMFKVKYEKGVEVRLDNRTPSQIREGIY